MTADQARKALIYLERVQLKAKEVYDFIEVKEALVTLLQRANEMPEEYEDKDEVPVISGKFSDVEPTVKTSLSSQAKSGLQPKIATQASKEPKLVKRK